MRHGVDISALDSAPPMPTDLSNIPVQDLTHIISKRMVIPLTDQTAQEVLDLVNKRYAASRIVTTQQ
jgi:hypothetical protein